MEILFAMGRVLRRGEVVDISTDGVVWSEVARTLLIQEHVDFVTPGWPYYFKKKHIKT